MKHFKLLPVVALAIVCILNEFRFAESHAILMNPPSRSSLWRYEQFKTRKNVVPNTSDSSLFCGGFQYQKSVGMKCGTCGDPYGGVRDNEAGGKYAQHTVLSRCLLPSERTMEIEVYVTANHKGFFEFRICPNNDFKKRVSLDCLNKNLLRIEGKSGNGPDAYRHYIGKQEKLVKTTVVIPEGLTCKQCVLQWRYRTANNWGKCDDGSSGLGCGPQEHFYGCADIAIVDDCTGVVNGERDLFAEDDANKADGDSWNDNEQPGEGEEDLDCEE